MIFTCLGFTWGGGGGGRRPVIFPRSAFSHFIHFCIFCFRIYSKFVMIYSICYKIATIMTIWAGMYHVKPVFFWEIWSLLRYCQARWIWLKAGLFYRSSLKSEARRFSEKPIPPLSCESPLKLQPHCLWLLAILKWISNARMKFITPYGLCGTCVGFFKGWTEIPHSLWRDASVFKLVPTSPQASSSRVHNAVANIREGSIQSAGDNIAEGS